MQPEGDHITTKKAYGLTGKSRLTARAGSAQVEELVALLPWQSLQAVVLALRGPAHGVAE
jgi:hypothetical protein